MAPLLLDNRALLKLLGVTLLIMLTSFAAGFITGYNKAAQTLSPPEAVLPLPEPRSGGGQSMAESVGQRAEDGSRPDDFASAVAEGAEIDVDVPAPKGASPDGNPGVDRAAARENRTAPLPVAPPAAASPGRHVEARAPVDDDDAGGPPPEVPSTAGEAGRGVVRQGTTEVSDGAVSTAGDGVELLRGAATADNARYSIQIGMYGNRVNAENLVVLLMAEGYAAYLSEYTNKNHQLRYNVRFGYYGDKQRAMRALQHYADNHQGNGYLVRLQPAVERGDEQAPSGHDDQAARF